VLIGERKLVTIINALAAPLQTFAKLYSLTSDIIGASGRSDIKFKTSVEKLEVSSGKAAALGLVLNEILTNAIKHAYADGRSGELLVFARNLGKLGEITIVDDGPGMDPNSRKPGLGCTLITRLSRQIHGTAEWTCVEPGTRVSISFTLGE
jgi:two-component sensor histidine kinase